SRRATWRRGTLESPSSFSCRMSRNAAPPAPAPAGPGQKDPTTKGGRGGSWALDAQRPARDRDAAELLDHVVHIAGTDERRQVGRAVPATRGRHGEGVERSGDHGGTSWDRTCDPLI